MPADDAIIQLVQPAMGRWPASAWSGITGAACSVSHTHLRDRDAAEDLAQEVFVKLWKALPRYDGRAQLSTWIYAITRNAAVSALRARRRRLSLSDPLVQVEAENIAARSTDATDDATLRRRIEALPDKQRQAVTLYYMDAL